MAKTGTNKYVLVVDALREQISSGALSAGDWLPSESELIAQYGLSRYSVREAIKKLVADGLVVVVDGKGSYVRARRDHATHADTRAIWTVSGPGGRARLRDGENTGWVPAETPGIYRTVATADLALAMGVHEHTPLFVYDRLLASSGPQGAWNEGSGGECGRNGDSRGVGVRRMLHRLYLPFSTCVDIPALAENPFRAPDELYDLLTEAGYDLRFIETVRATVPAPDDTITLHTPTGVPILITRRLTLDVHGRTLALEETRRSAEETQLTYPLIPTSPADAPAGITMLPNLSPAKAEG